MLPVQILLLLHGQTRQFGVHILLILLLIVPLHPKQQPHREKKHTAARRQIESISNMVVRFIEREETPCADEPTHITKHDVGANGTGAGSIADHVGRDLGVAQGAEGEGTGGDEEGCAVADLRFLGGEEHDVTDHHEGRGDDEEDASAVEAP